jgi:hypothetical protein
MVATVSALWVANWGYTASGAASSFCAGDVRNVGVHLAGVDGVVLQAIDLGALDLAVPVRAFHQADHQPVAGAPGQVHHPVNHEWAALLVRLNHKPHALPALQRGGGAQGFQQVQRNVEPVGLFGVDVQANVVFARQCGQVQHAGQEFVQYTLVLGAAVARVQGRQLDGNARTLHHAVASGAAADGVNGCFVSLQIALRVVRRQRGFTQHVVRVAKALGLHVAGALQRLANGFAGHELLAQHAHGHVHALADERLAAFAHQAGERVHQRAFAVGGHQLAGQQQAPRCGVDKQRIAAAQVLVPVTLTNLVAYQGVARGGIGYAQQRFGQTHQGHAFFAGQGIFLHQALHPPCAAPLHGALAQALHHLAGQRVGALGQLTAQLGQGHQRRQCFGFGQACGAGHGLAQRAAVGQWAAGGEVFAEGHGADVPSNVNRTASSGFSGECFTKKWLICRGICGLACLDPLSAFFRKVKNVAFQGQPHPCQT